MRNGVLHISLLLTLLPYFPSGATEGNCGMMNMENKVGAVGSNSVCAPNWLLQKVLPLYIIKVDRDTNEVTRDSRTGFCIQCAPGEGGEFIGKIVKGDPLKDFVGYQDKEATEKKILRNVFAQGDLYFRSGDYMVKDEFGWLYFLDRLGDTFRYVMISYTHPNTTIINYMAYP